MKKNNWKVLICLVAVFLLPALFARAVYVNRAALHFHYMNHGELIRPAVNDSVFYRKVVEGHYWLILQISEKHCDSQCRMLEVMLPQVKKALGNAGQRVQVVRRDVSSVWQMGAHWLPGIYLVDPNGNFFMKYGKNADLMGVLKDMQRVLEVSQIG